MSLRTTLTSLSLCLAMACSTPDERRLALREQLAGSNVLLIAIDSLANAHTSLSQYERDTTPVLASLAEEGVQFADVTAGSSNSFASVATLFRGEAVPLCEARRPGEVSPERAPHLAVAFQEAGYRTTALSTHPAFRSELGHQRGFDEFAYAAKTPGQGVTDELHKRFDRALEQSGETPFFIYIQLGTARAPREPMATRSEALLGHAPDPNAGTIEFLARMKSAAAAPKRTLLALDIYDSVLNDIDLAIGRLWESVERAGRSTDTLLVVAGTCGQAFGQRGQFGAGRDVHQEQIAVPLILRLPGALPKGLAIHEPVALYDLFPTLVDLFGLDVPASRSGASLANLINEDWLERPWLVSASTVDKRPQYSMRLGHFKLIDRAGDSEKDRSQLYNLERDELETSDHGPQRPETKAELNRELARFLATARELVGQPETIEIPADLINELRALGYSF